VNFTCPGKPDFLTFSIAIQFFTRFSIYNKLNHNQLLINLLSVCHKNVARLCEGEENMPSSTTLIKIHFWVELIKKCDLYSVCNMVGWVERGLEFV
jgi:hypothetical protein